MSANQLDSFLTKLNIKFPIIQAPMAGGATTPALVAAVSNAGGLGSLGAGYLSPDDLRLAIRSIRDLTTLPFAVNLFIPQVTAPSVDEIKAVSPTLNNYRKELGLQSLSYKPKNYDQLQEQVAVIIEEKVPVFSFTFGIPSIEILKKLKANNVVIMGTATTVNEGIQLEKIGCDVIVAQGGEAGGHRGTFHGMFKTSLIGTMALVPQLADKVNVPVIAAGGIMDGRGLAAALALGAAGVQMGTAFLTCHECGIHRKYKDALLASNEESTVVTSVFSGKPARGISNRFIQEMEAKEQKLPAYPIQHDLTQDIRKEAAKQNRVEFMSLWAGQGTRLNKEKKAADLVKETIEEAAKIFAKQPALQPTLRAKL